MWCPNIHIRKWAMESHQTHGELAWCLVTVKRVEKLQNQVRHWVCHPDPWPDTTQPKLLTNWPVTRDPKTRFQHCYSYWPLVFSQWSPHLHRALQCSLARIQLQSPVLHAHRSNDSSLQLMAAWSTVVAIVNHSPPTVARIRKHGLQTWPAWYAERLLCCINVFQYVRSS